MRRNLFNQLPTTEPFNFLIKADDTVVGNVFASDAENDALTYTLTKLPDFGTVQITPDGGYTYTPGAGFNGYDSFTIAVADSGFNLLDPLATRSTDTFVEVPYWSKGGLTTNIWSVRNFTATPVTLTSLFNEPGYGEAWDDSPPLGTVLQPGDEAKFELTNYLFYSYGAGPNFTSPTGNKWNVVFYQKNMAGLPWGYRYSHCDVGDCRIWNSGADYMGVLLLDAPGTVTINSETPGALDALNTLIKFVGDNTGGGADAAWDRRWTATYDNVTYTGNNSQWTAVSQADNATDNPKAASGAEVETFSATTTTTSRQCAVSNCDYGFNLDTAGWLGRLAIKAVTKDPNPVANTFGMSKATMESTKYTYSVDQGTMPWSANEIMLAPSTVDVVGDVTITYSDWCTTPSCTTSDMNQGAGGPRSYVFKDVAFTMPNFNTGKASFNMLTEPLQPKNADGTPKANIGFKVLDLESKFPDGPTYTVGDTAKITTIAYNGYGYQAGNYADFTTRATYTSSNPKVAVVDERGKLTALAPGTATITARYDWSMPLGGNMGVRSDYVIADMSVTVKKPWWQLF